MAAEHRDDKGEPHPIGGLGEVPVVLRRLWDVPAASQRGRPASLGLADVVAAALGVADQDGLRAVTMTSVARRLNVTGMALYSYVDSKEQLLVLLQDAAAGPAPVIDTPAVAWREGLQRWAQELRDRYRSRPWLARMPISGPPAGPRQLAWLEAALVVLRGTRLPGFQKIGVVTLVSGYVRQDALLTQDLHGGRGDTDPEEASRAYGHHLAQLLDAERFPQLRTIVVSGLFEAPPASTAEDPDYDFHFGLHRILDGVAALIR